MRFWPRRFRRRERAIAASSCPASCPLSACTIGLRATVTCVACPAHDARRLRSLGVFEGARVNVVDTRNGILLDVRGSRLALDAALAMQITVSPVVP